ncbi:hypothetical protein [Rhizobium sp. LjRoot258]|jgi:hypothetical protein|uniref:hypothetical protein n=1 Tax=Rhizobium sp. LjRoot258 TaxID=3342299 RepID=UPI003ECFC576
MGEEAERRSEHRERCETACYKCLQRYNNRNFHGLLDWRLGLSYLRAFLDPAYECGFDGKYEAFEIEDWRANAQRLAEQTTTFISGNKVSHIDARPDIPMFTLDGKQSRWGVVVHPLWDQEKLFSNLGLNQRFVAIDTSSSPDGRSMCSSGRRTPGDAALAVSTAEKIVSAILSAVSCSHNLRTVQPNERRCFIARASRARFRSIF